jgi:hypothetical protein
VSMEAGRLVFWASPEDDEPMYVHPLPDGRAVMVDIPLGATSVVVVSPVFTQTRRGEPWAMLRRLLHRSC